MHGEYDYNKLSWFDSCHLSTLNLCYTVSNCTHVPLENMSRSDVVCKTVRWRNQVNHWINNELEEIPSNCGWTPRQSSFAYWDVPLKWVTDIKHTVFEGGVHITLTLEKDETSLWTQSLLRLALRVFFFSKTSTHDQCPFWLADNSKVFVIQWGFNQISMHALQSVTES